MPEQQEREVFHLPSQAAAPASGLDLVSLSQPPAPTVARAADQTAHRNSLVSDITAPFRFAFSELGKLFDSATAPPPDPARKVGDPTGLLYATPDVSRDTINTVANTLYRMPPAILDTIEKRGTKIEIYAHASQDPSGDASAAAYYDPQQNRVAIYADSGMVQEAATHEFAHVWDGPKFSVEEQPAFKQALTADLNAIQSGQGAGAFDQIRSSGELSDQPTVDGVKTGDVFAEIVAGLAGYNTSGMPAQLIQLFPRTSRYIYNTVVNQDNALIAQQQQQPSAQNQQVG